MADDDFACYFCDRPAANMSHCDTCLPGGGGAYACGEHETCNVEMMFGAHMEMAGGRNGVAGQDERGGLIRFEVVAGHGVPAGTHTVRFLVRAVVLTPQGEGMN